MGRPVLSGFELVAKRDRTKPEDQPVSVPMRPERRGEQRRNPSTDQRRVRQQMQRQRKSASLPPEDHAFLHEHAKAYGGEDYAEWYMREHGQHADTLADVPDHPHAYRHFLESQQKESSMTTPATEADILATMATASPADRRRLAAQLSKMRADRTAKIESDRSIDFARTALAYAGPTGPTAIPALSPLQVTAESDWLGTVVPDEQPVDAVVNEATAEASMWYDGLHEAVKQDPHEFIEQAQGMAWHVAGRWGTQANIGADAFVRQATRLRTIAANPDTPPASAYAPLTNGSSLPAAVDNDKTFDEEITPRTPSTKVQPGPTPSLAEGNTPEGDHSESSENPIADQSNFAKDSTPPNVDYLDGTKSPWSGAQTVSSLGYAEHALVTAHSQDARYPGLHSLARVNPAVDEWGFMQHTAADYCTCQDPNPRPGPNGETVDGGIGGCQKPIKDAKTSRRVHADDQDTADVKGQSPSLSEGGPIEGDHAEQSIVRGEDMSFGEQTVKDGGNTDWVDPLNGNRTTQDGKTSSLRTLSALSRAIQDGEASRGRLVTPQARNFLMALAALDTADETFGGVAGRDIIGYLNATVGTLTSPTARQALAEMQRHLAGEVPPQFRKKDDDDDSDKGGDGSVPSNVDDEDKDKFREQQDGVNGDSNEDPDDDGKAEDGSSNSAQKDDDSDDSSDKDDDDDDDDGKKKSLPPWMQNKSSSLGPATAAFRARVQASLRAEAGGGHVFQANNGEWYAVNDEGEQSPSFKSEAEAKSYLGKSR